MRIEVDDSLLDITLPKLCIHPLVENALKYGTNCSPPWTVKIYSITRDDFWKICVEDTGPGFSKEALDQLKEQVRHLPLILQKCQNYRSTDWALRIFTFECQSILNMILSLNTEIQKTDTPLLQ